MNEEVRKAEHLKICLEDDVEPVASPFAEYVLASTAFPEMNFEDVCTKTRFLGREFALPLLISGMTGGTQNAAHFNKLLACAAAQFHIPFGLGSLKILAAQPKLLSTFDVRRHPGCRELYIIGNIGVCDLGRVISYDTIAHWVETLRLDAFAVHSNALQEAVQPEGTPFFADALRRIEELVKYLGIPVIVKEVGAGIATQDYVRLKNLGVAAVDVGGVGGTSWSLIEGLRGDAMDKRVGQLFSKWGISTPQALQNCAKTNDGPPLIATGGIRSGKDMAVALALGAKMCGVALPFLRAAALGEAALQQELRFFERSLRISLFCMGVRQVTDLGLHNLLLEHFE